MQPEKSNIEAFSADEYDVARRKLARIVGLGVTLFTGLIFLLTLSTGAFPGESADLMVAFSGIEPKVAPSHTIWGAIVAALASFNPEGMILRLNLFSLVVALLSVWLLFDIVVKKISGTIDPENATPRATAVASVLGGGAAALALAFSVPFWMCATRLQYQGFNVLLILILFRLITGYVHGGGLWNLMVAAFLLGVATVESLGIIIFAPIFVLYALRHWMNRGHASAGSLFSFGALFALGLASSWLIAIRFNATHDISLRGYESVWMIVLRIFIDQYEMLKSAFPVNGWLNLAIVVVAPAIASDFIARRALNETREWGIMIMHAVFTVAVVLVLGNTPAVSPWGIYRTTEVLPVPLMVLTAMTCGYLIAYWYLLVANRSQINIDGERSAVHSGSIWFGCFFGAFALVAIPVTSGINLLEANGRAGKFVDECVSEFIDSLGPRRWIISNGLFDSHLLLEAHRTGRDIKVVKLQNNDSKVYLRYLRNIIKGDSDIRPEDADLLAGSVEFGVLPFVQDWIECDPSAIDKMAIVNTPDLIVAVNKVVVPHKFFFTAGNSLDEVKKTSFLEANQEFWGRMKTLLAKERGSRDSASAFRAIVRRQVGFVANNTGVLLEDLGRDEEAFQTYNFVRQFDTDNVSALLNLIEILRRNESKGFHNAERKAIESSFENVIKKLEGRKLPIWSLSRTFGYVRSPVLFTQLGWAWAASGQPGIAIAGIRRAESVAQTAAGKVRAQESMAEVLWRQNDIEGSERIYEDILKQDPENTTAMLNLSRIQARRGSLDKARDWLSKAQSKGARRAELAFEGASLDLAAGAPAAARIKLNEITDVEPNNIQAWALLGIAAVQMGDYEEVETRVLKKIAEIAGTTDNYQYLIVRGQLLFQKGEDLVGARDAFERASISRPGITMLLEWILQLDFMLNDKAAAEEHARQILRTNRNNSFANYIMGSIMLYRGRIPEAENYLRRSISSANKPEPLNDLAELLRMNGNFEEAERYIHSAIQLAPGFYILWDTLGGILFDKGDFAGAEEAYLKAIELFKDDGRVYLNYATLLLKKGETVKAREMVMKVNANRSSLDPADLEKLSELVKKVTPGKKR